MGRGAQSKTAAAGALAGAGQPATPTETTVQLIATKRIIAHDPDNALYNKVIEPGEAFEFNERAAAVLIRDGEATAADAAESGSGEETEDGAGDGTGGGTGVEGGES